MQPNLLLFVRKGLLLYSSSRIVSFIFFAVDKSVLQPLQVVSLCADRIFFMGFLVEKCCRDRDAGDITGLGGFVVNAITMCFCRCMAVMETFKTRT